MTARASALLLGPRLDSPLLAEACAAVHGRPPAELFAHRPARLEVILDGVPAAVANALRRALDSEMPWKRLSFAETDFECSDPYMSAGLVLEQVRRLPLLAGVRPGGRHAYRLEVVNRSSELRRVTAADLVPLEGGGPPPCSPGYELARLMPGQRLAIARLEVETGSGREHCTFCATAQAGMRPLDLPQHPRALTHGAPPQPRAGDAASLAAYQAAVTLAGGSGYAVSMLTAEPRRFLVHALVKAVQSPREALLVGADACRHLSGRLMAVAANLHGPAEGCRYEPTEDGGVLRLLIPGETPTVGGLLVEGLRQRAGAQLQYAGAEPLYHKKALAFTLRLTGGDQAAARGMVETVAAEQAALFARWADEAFL